MNLLGKEGAASAAHATRRLARIVCLPWENTTVSMILLYFVTLALAATVAMWIAPMALWQSSERPDDLPSGSPAQVRVQVRAQVHAQVHAHPAAGGLQVWHEGSE